MRTILLILACGFIYSTSISQHIRSYGIKAGYASASQNWDYGNLGVHLPLEHRPAVSVGAYVEWLDLPVVSLSTEIFYCRKGMKMSIPITTETQPDGTGEYYYFTPYNDYLSIPVLAKARLSGTVISPYIIAGPRADFLLSTSDYGSGFLSNDFKSVNFGMTLGAGTEFNVGGPAMFGVEFRYNPNLTATYSNRGLTVKNNTFELLAFVGI